MYTRYVIYVGIVIVTGFVAALSALYFPFFDPLLLFIPTIAYCAWYGGFIGGIVTTIFSIANIIVMYFYLKEHSIFQTYTNLFFEMAIFFVIGIFISFIVHSAKQQDKITDYKKKLRQSHHINEMLEKYLDNAQKEIQARDQFLAIASHELKTPVTSMILQVQTAIHNIRNVSLANFSAATLLKMLEDTEQQSKRLSKMVNDLLNLSLITTGKVNLEPEKIDLSEIVSSVARQFSNRLSDKKQLQVFSEKQVIGNFDKVRIEQVIVNLISNALKYGDNKPISIHVSEEHGWAKIMISDHGIGIPQDQQKKIFNRFERAVSSRDYKGLGVGLYITYQIVLAHKGKIHVQSKPNQGSSFIIELPLS